VNEAHEVVGDVVLSRNSTERRRDSLACTEITINQTLCNSVTLGASVVNLTGCYRLAGTL